MNAILNSMMDLNILTSLLSLFHSTGPRYLNECLQTLTVLNLGVENSGFCRLHEEQGCRHDFSIGGPAPVPYWNLGAYQVVLL